MKIHAPSQSSSTARGAVTTKLVLTGLIAAAASLAFSATSSAQISTQPFKLDGQFTGGFTPTGPNGEWSDVTPFAFISSPGGTASTSLSDPLKNTLLYGAISHNVASSPGELQLHLMYDFLPLTAAPFAGQIFASVTFPVTLPGRPKDNISIIFQGAGGSLFDTFVDLDVNNPSNTLAPLVVGGVDSGLFPGLLAATTISPSSLSATPHLLVELEVPLRIPAGFGTGPLPGGGINPLTGMYDPDPVFWGASAGGGGGSQGGAGGGGSGLQLPPPGDLQPATTVTIGINPDGSLNIVPVPEPTAIGMLLGSLGLLGARRRRTSAGS